MRILLNTQPQGATHQRPADVSLIVLNWNGRRHLRSCLTSLAENHYEHCETVLVDNGSTDGSLDLASAEFPDVRVVENGRNLGYAGGMNVGIAHATGDVVVLLNNDIIVEPTWLAALMAAFASDRRIGIAGCKILYPDSMLIQHAGGYISFPLGYADHFGYRKVDDGSYDTQADVGYVTGAAMAIRRALLDEIGYLDTQFYPAYYEDVDLCYRARQANWRVVYVPRARLVHFESATSVRDSIAYFTWFHQGRLRFVLKQLSVQRFLEEFVPAERERFYQLTLAGERRAVKRAYKSSLRMLPTIFTERLGTSDSAFSSLQWVAEALSNLHAQVV